LTDIILLLHALSTFAMLGIIWFVQVVHYPLFARVGEAGFALYAQTHSRLTTWVVAPPMLLELATGVLLLWMRPEGVALWPAIAGAALLGVVWLATAALSVPRHKILVGGFDPDAWRALCLTNWLRTAAWTIRAVLVIVMLAAAIE